MRLLLRAHAICFSFNRVVEPRLLGNFSAAFDDFNLALYLVFQRLANEAERIHIFDFGLSAEFLLTSRPDAHVSIAAQRAFFHVDVAHAGIKDDLLQSR